MWWGKEAESHIYCTSLLALCVGLFFGLSKVCTFGCTQNRIFVLEQQNFSKVQGRSEEQQINNLAPLTCKAPMTSYLIYDTTSGGCGPWQNNRTRWNKGQKGRNRYLLSAIYVYFLLSPQHIAPTPAPAPFQLFCCCEWMSTCSVLLCTGQRGSRAWLPESRSTCPIHCYKQKSIAPI